MLTIDDALGTDEVLNRLPHKNGLIDDLDNVLVVSASVSRGADTETLQ